MKIPNFNILNWDVENSFIDTLDVEIDQVSFYSMLNGDGGDVFRVNREDTIRLAKHFKLTPEDLK